MNYFKQSIEILENSHHSITGGQRSLNELQLLDKFFAKDQIIPSDFNEETEEFYFSLLKSKNIGKPITNLSEYLLEKEGSKG